MDCHKVQWSCETFYELDGGQVFELSQSNCAMELLTVLFFFVCLGNKEAVEEDFESILYYVALFNHFRVLVLQNTFCLFIIIWLNEISEFL